MYQIPIISKIMQGFQNTGEGVVGIQQYRMHTRTAQCVVLCCNSFYDTTEIGIFLINLAHMYWREELYTSTVLLTCLLHIILQLVSKMTAMRTM